MPSKLGDEELKDSTWAFILKGRKINIYFQKIDLSKDAGVPKYSQLLWSKAVSMRESQNHHKWGHALMQLLETHAHKRIEK